jgi:hypothetical protein
LAVEFAVEDLFPGAEVEFSAGNGDDRFPAHDLPLQVGVGVDFAGVVAVGGDRFVGGEFFKPLVKILVQARFVVVDKDAGGDLKIQG